MSEQREDPTCVTRRRFMSQMTGAAVLAGGVVVSGASPVAQRASAADVRLARSAFEALAKGEPNLAIETLDADVRWEALATREAGRGATLDRRGARTYLDQMARSISSGERALEIRSVTPEGDTVRVVSAWVERGRSVQECANIVHFAGGKVIRVIEAAR